MSLEFRKAFESDANSIMNIINQAQYYFKKQGIDQWQDNYPNYETVCNDIANNYGYVFLKDKIIIGTAAVSFDGEKTYEHIYDGKWISNGEYAVIHRMAIDSKYKGLGLATLIIENIEEICLDKDVHSIKIDTHKENLAMQKLLKKNGFKYCGIIYLEDGSERIAFEKAMRSEKEKMLAGDFYDANDEELVKERGYARNLTFEFNHTKPSEKKKKQEILKQLIVAKGSFYIEAPFHCDYGYNIEIGENFYANFGCVILDVNKVQIGNNVLLAPNVQIYTATHPIDPKERIADKEFAKPIIIGNNVWIGGGTIICPGVKIGDNVTIGAGSVVTKDIPNNVVAVGNPCKMIRKI